MTETRSIPFGRPWITEEDQQAVLQVLQGHILTHGPVCKQFEEKFAEFMGGEAYAVTVSSGMAALHLSYFLMDIGPGDEVIVPAQTHNATVHAVEMVGAKPVFADCLLETGNVNPDAIEPLITPATRAVSVVHFDGIPCQMDRILDVASRYNLMVVEDCALAVGARYKGRHVGLLGDAGIFSFYPVKHITTGEGGMFVSRHKEVAEKAARLRAFGVDRTHTERVIPGFYDVVALGLNYRMSEMSAALGISQLSRINEILEKRKANFTLLKSLLQDIKDVSIIDSNDDDCASSNYCMSVLLGGDLLSHRDDVVFGLKEAGIGTSIYYPHPIPRLTYYRNKYGLSPDTYANAAEISDHSIALPVAPHIDADGIEYIAENFKRVIEEVKS